MRIGEVTLSQHTLKARDVHIAEAENKDKIMLVLYSSKTHDESMRPQKIKTTSNSYDRTGNYLKRHFCPFKLMRDYIKLRGNYLEDNEQFLVHRDVSPVTPNQVRQVFKTIITRISLDHTVYGLHSFHIGRTTDLIKYNYSLEQVRIMGR